METVWQSVLKEAAKLGFFGFGFLLAAGGLLVAWMALRVVLAALRREK